MKPYIFQRGETIQLALDAVTGDPLTVSAVTASLKKALPGDQVPPSSAVADAAFVVTARAAVGDIPAGWTLTITAAVSLTLAAGRYVVDARLVLAGGVIITDFVVIAVRESVTP